MITGGWGAASSSAFRVGAAGLASFEWNHVNDQTAGAQFHQTATAYDRFGNIKTDYPGGALLSNDMAGTKMGRAACRERGKISVVVVSLKKKGVGASVGCVFK